MPETLAQRWAETVASDPRAMAVTDAASGQLWSRAQLAAEAAALADVFGDRSQLRGRRVILGGVNSAAWLAAFLALSECGAVPVPIDPGEPVAARLAIAKAVGAKFAWTEGRLVPLMPSRKVRRHGPDVCLIKLTSGSTGTPRALPFTHAQMLADGRQVCTTMGIRSTDTNLALIPFGHSYGLGNLVLPLIALGTSVICGSGPLPGLIATDCERWRPTVLPTVPAVLRALALSEIPSTALASLRTVISAGAPLTREIAAAFLSHFNIRIHGFYGSSETGGICYDRDGSATLEGRSVSHPMHGVTLHFRAARRFVVESAAVMRRGRHMPADMGHLNEFGELVLLGRTGRILKLAGRRLDLGEIEARLREISGVREAFAMAHPSRPDSVAALVGGDMSTGEVRTALTRTLAAWKVPHRIVVVRDWPLTARGKADKVRVQALLAATGP